MALGLIEAYWGDADMLTLREAAAAPPPLPERASRSSPAVQNPENF